MSKRTATSSRAWIVAQLGRREHYLAARALHRQGALDCLLTDVWEPHGKAEGLLALVPAMKSASRNWHPDLERADVRDWGAIGAGFRLTARLLAKREAALHRLFNAQGAAFAGWTARQTARRDVSRSLYFGFSSSSLEAMTALKARGVPCLLDQIDPAETEMRLIEEERSRWPGWEGVIDDRPQEYLERLRREWDVADRIIVNSEWSRTALVSQGVDAGKISVIPLAYEIIGPQADAEKRRSSRLQVLWLGSVILRKGFPYLVEAARQLLAEPIDFIVAGPHKLSASAVAQLPPNLRLVGKVNELAAKSLWQGSDVFVLPTLSDGFAITQLEAMAHALPVITTSHCGDVVRDGVDGYIIPIRDPGALAARLGALAHDPALVERMSSAAVARARDFSLDAYARALTDVAATL